MENALYLLQVSGCIISFYGVYIVFFRSSTFFRANRIYLLVALLFSFVIPILDFSVVTADYHLPATDFLNVPPYRDLHIKAEYMLAPSSSDTFNFISLIYWLGFGFIIARLLHSIVGLIRLKNR